MWHPNRNIKQQYMPSIDRWWKNRIRHNPSSLKSNCEGKSLIAQLKNWKHTTLSMRYPIHRNYETLLITYQTVLFDTPEPRSLPPWWTRFDPLWTSLVLFSSTCIHFCWKTNVCWFMHVREGFIRITKSWWHFIMKFVNLNHLFHRSLLPTE